jgi:hypothetical protein
MWSRLAATLLSSAGAAPRLVDADGAEQAWPVQRWCGGVSAAESAHLAQHGIEARAST